MKKYQPCQRLAAGLKLLVIISALYGNLEIVEKELNNYIISFVRCH